MKKKTRRRFRIRKIDFLCQFSLRSLHGMPVSIRTAFTLFIIVVVARQTHTLITKIDELLISSFVFACSHFTLNCIAFFLIIFIFRLVSLLCFYYRLTENYPITMKLLMAIERISASFIFVLLVFNFKLTTHNY